MHFMLCVFDHNKKKSKYPASVDMSDLQTGHPVPHGNNQLELRSLVPFGSAPQVANASPSHCSHVYHHMAPEGMYVFDLQLNYKALYKCSL